MAETKREKLLSALDKFLFGSEKFADIKVGDKTYKHSGEKFETGVDVFDGENPLADGEYQTETQKFTVKSGKVIDLKAKEAPAPAVDFSAQIKTVTDAYEAKLAAQKTDFDAQVNSIKDTLNKKIDDLVNGKLKEIFDIVKQISELPSAPSAFSKKDGEPPLASKGDVFAEAKALSEKIFPN